MWLKNWHRCPQSSKLFAICFFDLQGNFRFACHVGIGSDLALLCPLMPSANRHISFLNIHSHHVQLSSSNVQSCYENCFSFIVLRELRKCIQPEHMPMKWDWLCIAKKGEQGHFQDPFKECTYCRSGTHGAVVGNVLRIAFLCIVGTTTVVRELANSLDKGSAKNQQASVPSAVNVIRTIPFWDIKTGEFSMPNRH